MKRFLRDVSLLAVVAGLVAVLVGYTSLVMVIFAAGRRRVLPCWPASSR